MKNLHRKTLLAAALVCLAPAALAAEASLTPGSNGGSGAMPSGYSTLNFEIAENDFASTLKLPENPRNGDRVVLSSVANSGARLSATGTSVADLVYLPVESASDFELLYSSKEGRWMATSQGTSERRVVLSHGDRGQVPSTDALLTDVHVGGDVTMVKLPASAPRGAVLGMVNYTQNDLYVQAPKLAGGIALCAASKTCTYVFDGSDGKWHARSGRAHFQPTTAQLPKMQQRWTDIVTGNPAEDLVTPLQMYLPTDAVDGDIIQLSDPSNSNSYRVSNTVLSSVPLTVQYNAQQGRWSRQKP